MSAVKITVFLLAQIPIMCTVKVKIMELDELVLDHAYTYKSCRILMCIPKIGPMTAAYFVLAVYDVDRFKNTKSVGGVRILD